MAKGPASRPDLSADEMRDKAKWHQSHPKVGNQNLADSYARSALLKQRHEAQVKMADAGKSGPTKMEDYPVQNAKGGKVEMDDNNWPKGTGKWAFRD